VSTLTKTDHKHAHPQSFETARAETFGDLLSAQRGAHSAAIKVGLMSGAFFEYWRMYPTLKGTVEGDAEVVLRRLSPRPRHRLSSAGRHDGRRR